jgi:hypothetical protein
MQNQALEPVTTIVHRANAEIIILDKFVLFPLLATVRVCKNRIRSVRPGLKRQRQNYWALPRYIQVR